MSSLRPGYWPLVLVLLMQIQPVSVQGVNPVSQKVRRLNEQFQQFQTVTQARLDMLALNQNRNSTGGLQGHFQALSDHWHSMSQDLEHFKQSTTQEIQGLREWSRKLVKKSKRMEGRLALMERNVRENNRRHTLKQKPDDPNQDLFNLTLELQSQEEMLGALQVQRDELLIGLKGLQESLKKQALRVTRLEGRFDEFLQFNGAGTTRGLWRAGETLNSNVAPKEEFYEPRRRSQTHREGGRPERILEGHTQTRPEGMGDSQINGPLQATGQNRILPKPDHQATPKQPKHSKARKLRPQPETHPVVQVQHPKYRGRSPQLHSHPSWPQSLSKAPSHPEANTDRQIIRTRLEAPKPPTADVLHPPQSETYQPRVEGQEEESDAKVEFSAIHDLLQLPVRQKIPARPVPKKDATICNVDSLLFFPSASVNNYVTFDQTLPDLPELSVCLWLRVEASHVGTLLSYATDDMDNQLVLYGRNSSASSVSLSSSSWSSHASQSSSPYSPSSSTSLDFVIGDPVYRRLPALSLLDTRWHHLCVLWSSIQGRFWHYTDRRLTSSGSNFRKGWEVPGGGSVVLGQEQDTVGGGFDPAEGFAGRMAGFWLWNRVLSPSEVEGVAEGRGVPRGVVLGMEDIKEVHGEVQQVACECLEHCF